MNTLKIRFARKIDSMFSRGGTLVVLASILILFPMIAFGATVDLAWDANTEPDLDGYKIYYGTTSGNYSPPIDVGDVTEYTLTDLDEGVTYYIAATAYDVDDNESDYSVELVHTTAIANHNPVTPSLPNGPSSGYTQTNYTFSTTASDPDGDALQYRFDWDDGVISSWGAASQNHSWSSADIFCIKAQAKDSKGALSGWSDCRNITITQNSPPVADAGPDQTGLVGATVTLDGSGSSDVDGDPLTYSWSLTSVPTGSGATLSDPAAVMPTFVADLAGDYVVQLIVNDGLIDSAPDTVSISTQNSPPVADAGPDQTGLVGATVTLDGSGSSDVDGDPLTYSWSLTSVPTGSGATLSDPAAVMPTFVADLAGDYVVQLIVNDGLIDSAPDTVSISTQNSPPVADAGPDQTGLVGATVTLDGSGSSDVDGDPLTYSWSLTSVPTGSGATLSDPAAVMPTFVADLAGDYVVQLIVNDGLIDSAPDTVSISTQNSPPVADAGPDQTGLVGATVTLDGSGSSDVDGDPLTYSWSLTSVPTGSGATLSDPAAVMPTFVADLAGDYVVQLIVNDGLIDSAPDTVSISTQNSPPVADAGPDQTGLVGATVTLDGSGSSDVDGDPLTYSWSLTSVPTGSGATLSDPAAVMPTFVADLAGDYVVQLIVNDGLIDSAPDTVSISTQNSPPVADAGPDQTGLVGATVTLDGSGSSDVDGDPLTYSWSLTSVPTGSGATLSDPAAVMPTFVADLAGDYVVQLIVNDGLIDSAPDTVSISTQNSPPVADAGPDQTGLVGATVTLDGSGSSDVDGDPLTYSWSLTSVPTGSGATLSDPAAVMPTFVADLAGDYVVQLIVNDGLIDSAPDTVSISTQNSPPVADAGPDQTGLVGATVTLDGSGSSDVDGDPLTYSWSLTSVPTGSGATLSDPAAVMPTFVADLAGDYVVQLIVNDGLIDSAPDTVSISTQNSPPVADAGPDQTGLVGATVTLDGSGSSDVDGDPLTYSWSLTSVPTGSGATLSDPAAVMPTFVADLAGDYVVQLIVNDGLIDSAPDTVSISTQNSPPVADAGDDQTVEEGDVVTLNGINSIDPNDNITSYTWIQTGGATVNLTNPDEAESTFIAPVVATDPEMLTFNLTVVDAEGLQDTDTCSVFVTKEPVIDSDGDGVPDAEDDFPFDPDEHLDTDGDGEGNNADTDDDNDGMPDTWELLYGLDPLINDADEDPDGDEVSNINEYNLGTEPNNNEGNFEPYPPSLIAPDDHETVGLTAQLETGEFYDPNINDVHSQTQWKIIRVHDEFCVFDVSTGSSLTRLKVPKLILEDDTDYSWQVKYIDNQGGASQWSETGYFTTEFLQLDSDGNGVLDDQEVDATTDLDQDGIMDLDQEDIKGVATETGGFKIGVSIREAVNADSIVSIQSEAPDDVDLLLSAKAGPNFLAFGLIHFKLLVKEPGDEVSVTIYLSKAAYDDGTWYKYDPVNDQWFDYSDFIDFSADRKTVHLTLTDGGFGDADGIENGVIVDPLALRTATDHSSGSGSAIEDLGDRILPDLSCFISAAANRRSADRQAFGLGRDIRGSDLFTVFILMMLAYIAKEIFLRIRQSRRIGLKTSLMEGWRNS